MKPKRGRPPEDKPKFKPEFVKQAAKLCKLGATDHEVADFFEVNRTTLWRWTHTHAGLAEAMKTGKDVADERVVRSLYSKAIGYTFDSVKIFNDNGNALIVPYEEHVPPSDTACIFWLKNRRPEEWRDRHEHTGKDGTPFQVILSHADEAL